MLKIRINDAIKHHNKNNSNKISQKEIREALFPDSKPQTQVVNLSNLARGSRKTITLDAVHIICELTKVDANFLFGIEKM